MKRILALIGLSALLISPLLKAKDERASSPDTPSTPEFHVSTLEEELATPPKMLKPGPNDPAIAAMIGRILEQNHFTQRELDDKVSNQFLERYLSTLDNLRIHFTQADLKEFEPLREALDDLTLNGDVRPAYMIYERFLERLQQRAAYVKELLEDKDAFDFTKEESYVVDREDLPRPADLEEAKRLWRKYLKYELLQERLNASDEDEDEDDAETKIRNRYARLLHTLKTYETSNVLEFYLSSLTRVYDPHSDYLGVHQLENFQINMKLSLFGIGALLRAEDGYCKIQSLVPNGPASRSNELQEDDRIIAVAQGDDGKPVDVVDMNLMKIVQLIRGAKGTVVRLTVIPADAEDPSVRKEVRLVRDEITLEDQEAKARIHDVPREENGKTWRLGVIDLPSFYRDFNMSNETLEEGPKSTTQDVSILIRKLKKENVDGIILDLRRNGGGSLEEAISLTGLFIKEGPVVQVADPDGRRMVDYDRDPSVLYDGPLVVLTSRFSASASEILAGALQDYGRALVVGDESTHGKGTVQSLIGLDRYLQKPAGALKITIRKFYRATGSSTQKKGVTPDIILPSVNTVLDVGEASLENPLEWDVTQPAEFVSLNRIQPVLPELRELSQKRIDADPDFQYVIEEIDRMKEAKEKKAISLNEAERIREREEAKARAEKRKEELKKRPPTDETVYELTVGLAKEDGLPEPLDAKEAQGNGHGGLGQRRAVEDEDEEDSVSAPDVALKEAKRILQDFIRLRAGQDALAATRSGAN